MSIRYTHKLDLLDICPNPTDKQEEFWNDNFEDKDWFGEEGIIEEFLGRDSENQYETLRRLDINNWSEFVRFIKKTIEEVQ